MHLLIRQIPDQPGVDRSESQLSGLRFLTSARHILQYPTYFGRRKVGIHHQPRFFTDQFLFTFAFKFFAILSRPPVLPNNGPVNRLSRLPIPHNRGFPLVGNTNGRYLTGFAASFQYRLGGNRRLRGPYLHGVVFYPARFGVILSELFLSQRFDLSVLVEQDSTGTGGSLVKRENELFHANQLNRVVRVEKTGLFAIVAMSHHDPAHGP